MYRKRVKKSKLKTIDEVLTIVSQDVMEEGQRELTSKELKQVKKLYYSQRKKILKGYIDHDVFLNQVVCDIVNDAAKDVLESYCQSDLGRGLIHPTITFFLNLSSRDTLLDLCPIKHNPVATTTGLWN